MIIFIISRILDIITTLFNIEKYGGWEVELNPYTRWLGNQGIFFPYQILITILAVLIINKFRYQKAIYGGLALISFTAVIINIYCLII